MSSSSSALTTYDLTVPIFVRNLEQLVACLKKGEEWAKDNNKDPQVLVDASIIDDMKVRSNYLNQSLHIPAHDFFPRADNHSHTTAFDFPNSKLLQHFQSSFASHWRRRSSFCRGQRDDALSALGPIGIDHQNSEKCEEGQVFGSCTLHYRYLTYLFVLYVISLFPHPTRFFSKKKNSLPSSRKYM